MYAHSCAHLLISEPVGNCHMPGRFRNLGRWCGTIRPTKSLNQSPVRRMKNLDLVEPFLLTRPLCIPPFFSPGIHTFFSILTHCISVALPFLKSAGDIFQCASLIVCELLFFFFLLTLCSPLAIYSLDPFHFASHCQPTPRHHSPSLPSLSLGLFNY